MSRRHYRKAPPEMLGQLEAAARSGLPIAEQAKRLGVSVDRMYNLRSEHGLAKSTPRPSDEEDDSTPGCARCGLRGDHLCLSGTGSDRRAMEML